MKTHSGKKQIKKKNPKNFKQRKNFFKESPVKYKTGFANIYTLIFFNKITKENA